MKTFINVTPHAIVLNDGTTFPASGTVARVSARFSEIVDGFCTQTFGDVVDLPQPQEGVYYIVSAMVFAATDRADVVAPATGHPACIRNDKGQIVSVPCFLRQ